MVLDIHPCIPGTPDSPGMVKFDRQNRVSALLLNMKSAETRLWKLLSNDIGYDYRSVTFFQRFLLQQLHVAHAFARVPCAAVAVQI